MKYRRFEPKDLVHNTIVAKPEYNFIINSGKVYVQKHSSISGSFDNNIKHIDEGEISLHEININRPSGSLVESFIEKQSTRYAHKSVSTSEFDDLAQFAYGDTVIQKYPVTSSISRIYIPSGQEFNSEQQDAHENKKYIRALRNVINTQATFGRVLEYENLGTSEVNMLCIPGIFYGSSIDRGTVQLRFSITGSLVGTAEDIYKDGRLIQTYGPTTGSVVGKIIYNQGLILLDNNTPLDASYQDKYKSNSSTTTPSWTSFGTGMRQVGEVLEHGPVTGSTYTINFKGTNKIPTLTMYAYAKQSEINYSSNPSYLELTSRPKYSFTSASYVETTRKIKNVTKSDYSDHDEEYENTTYISKIGIYDKDKNLIAIATLANPVKKNENRDFMFKIGLDF